MIASYGFLLFLHYYFFDGKKFIADIYTELPCLGDFKNARSISGSEGTDNSVLKNLEISSLLHYITLHGFEVKESNADIPAKLKCSDDLCNLANFRFRMYSEVLMILTLRF